MAEPDSRVLRDEVLASDTPPWLCLSCYFCTVRCPMGIRIPDVMYGIKSIAIASGVAPERTGADFSSVFVSNIHRFGRRTTRSASWRFTTCATTPCGCRHGAGVGVSMLASGRMGFGLHRIAVRCPS